MVDLNRRVGAETSKSYRRKFESGFWQRFVVGTAVLEIGFRGHTEGHVPIFEGAIGVDLDFPGYNGITLPFADQSQDAVYSSHCLEHIDDHWNALREWYRVTRIGGHIIIVVPHAYLYERKLTVPPSLWNGDHKRSYTPASLMQAVENALAPNIYRVRHLCDNDQDYDYERTPAVHPHGCYEIELVIQRIAPPPWFIGP